MGESLPWDDIREFAAKWIVKAEKPPTFYTEQAVDTFANEILSLCVRAIEKNERNAVKSRDRRINSLASDNATLRSEVERLKFTMTTAAKGLRGQYAGRYEMAELLEISAALKPEATPND